MNFIDNIEIKNFKSIHHQKIEGCKKINVFIGYPNVGKSNILEAIGLYSVAQQVNGERFNFNSICRYNHLSDLYFDKNTKNRIEIILNKEFVLSCNNKNPGYQFEISIFPQNGLSVFNTTITDRNTFGLNSIPDNKTMESEVFKIKYYHFDKDAELTYQKGVSLSIPNGDNLIDILDGNTEVRKQFLELLSDYQLKLNIIDSKVLSVSKELNDGTLVSFQHNLISDTLRRLFFYRTAIQTNEKKVLIFEEPEANMFPPYIRKFTSEVIFDKSNQFFIASHSPYVLGEFMMEAKGDLSVFVVDFNKGETVIRRLSDDEMDEIAQYGIDLFFNLESYLDRYGESYSA